MNISYQEHNRRQEIFDKVWDTFVVKKTPFAITTDSSYGDTRCVYDHEINGVGCAVGCLLTKETATLCELEFANTRVADWYNFTTSTSIVRRQCVKEIGLEQTLENTDFLQALQYAHDFDDHEMLKGQLIHLAATYELKVPNDQTT
jgi:hypothetical protein